MSHSLNSLKGVVEGFIWGITIVYIRGSLGVWNMILVHCTTYGIVYDAISYYAIL